MILMIEQSTMPTAAGRAAGDRNSLDERNLRKCSQRTCMKRLGVYLPDDWKPESRPNAALRRQLFERRWHGLMTPPAIPAKANRQ